MEKETIVMHSSADSSSAVSFFILFFPPNMHLLPSKLFVNVSIAF